MNVARELIQQRGYNAVSYRDLAAEVEIKTASIHYYFPAKADLVEELVRRYRQEFADARAGIDRRARSGRERLAAFHRVLSDSFKATGRMCLCGLLAAETSSLPDPVNAEVRLFFGENESWLADVMSRGREDGTLRFQGAPESAGRGHFAALEGALLSAWTFGDERRLREAARWLLGGLQV